MVTSQDSLKTMEASPWGHAGLIHLAAHGPMGQKLVRPELIGTVRSNSVPLSS
jgi:hypothetical protein